MRVYISSDMEGVAGIVNDSFTGEEANNYQRACELQTGEVNACIEGVFNAGATHVVVNDAHGAMTNIRLEDLDNRAELITGSPKPLGMMEGVQEEMDLAMLTGYHTGQRGAGVLSHTYNYSVSALRVNGICLGETGLNALVAGWFRVPVALVTGDDRVTVQAKKLLGKQIETAKVKTALSRTSARTLTPEKAREIIAGASENAVQRAEEMRLYEMAAPYTMEIDFNDRGMAEKASLLPGADLGEAATVTYTTEDISELYRVFRIMLVQAR